MAGAINAIGVISGVLGILQFGIDNFAAPDPEGSTVQVKAGLECPDCSTFDGNIETVVGYDFYNQEVGRADGGHVGSGGTLDLTLDQSVPGVQSDFVSVSAGNDAVCIAWISVRQKDGVEAAGGAWNGDIGSSCPGPNGAGQFVYASEQVAGTLPDGGEWRPQCMWLDGDLTNDFPSASLKFDVNAFGNINSEKTLSDGATCSKIIYTDNKDPISAQPGAKRSVHKRATEVPRKEWMKNMVVSSTNYPGHNATELCANEYAWGPDFIGSDGNHCDMETRVVTPVCSFRAVEGCLDLETGGALQRRSYVAKRESNTQVKTYKTVQNWK